MFEFARMVAQVERLHDDLLFGPDDLDCADPFAVQEFLSAMAYLDLAHRALARADLHHTRALAENQRRGLIP